MAAEKPRGPLGAIGAPAKRFQGLGRHGQTAFEGFALDDQRAAIKQLIGVPAVEGPRENLQVREGFLGRREDFQRLFAVVDGDHQHL